MDKLVAAFVGLLCLAACAGTGAGGADVAGPLAPRVEAPASDAGAPAPEAQPPVVAFAVTPRAEPPPRQSGEDEVVIPGQSERQVPPPDGDPRSRFERREDIRAWDQCVIDLQGALESDPMGPQLQSPEEMCRGSLGMAGRDAVPDSRR